MSHLLVGTKDPAYGMENIQGLSPEQSLRCGDSFGYFSLYVAHDGEGYRAQGGQTGSTPNGSTNEGSWERPGSGLDG
ncbi:hypothetical protein O9K51_09610 [Purpureocillium lavendulum]|uniref:Uncharacterized protein n=1 Tax=Purpureocillium lavendulum TaxID=1247861 RepID=A0AB34FFG7_9HYPO|nr:hypothetical protein O9K51_09610 [Purpureocillium lavendulum]